MNSKLRKNLINIARQKIKDDDPSHDFEHALRVLANAENIARTEKCKMDIIIPAALFHDVVNYPKNDQRAKNASEESAKVTEKILKKIKYPTEKIKVISYCIKNCSFSKGIIPQTLEAKIIQDADYLEATGAISIMRTYSSTGSMKRLFYNSSDPFCKKRKPDDLKFALDLFFTRLLKIQDKIHTKTAKNIAKRRSEFLKKFLKEFELELKGK